MMKRNKPYTLFIYIVGTVAILSSLFSCHENVVFSHYHGVEVDGWDKTTHVEFNISPIPETGKYQESVGIRINSHYPFLSLNLIIEQTVYPSRTVLIDTIDCQLIDKDGRKLGKGQSLWQLDFPVKNINLQEGDSVNINIRHNMRRDILRGVSDIGFKLERK